MPDTKELIARCVERDLKAWDEFVSRYKVLVVKGIRYKLHELGLIPRREEVNDITQEVFLHIWEKGKLKNLRNITCLNAWLVMLSINSTSNHCRNGLFHELKNSVSLEDSISEQNPKRTFADIIPAAGLDTGSMLRSNELKTLIDKEISKLPHKQQLALKLRIYDGKKQRDIAEIMNIPIGTASILLKRAKDRIRKNLNGIFNEKI